MVSVLPRPSEIARFVVFTVALFVFDALYPNTLGDSSVTNVSHVPPKNPPGVCAWTSARQSAGLDGVSQPWPSQYPPLPPPVHRVNAPVRRKPGEQPIAVA